MNNCNTSAALNDVVKACIESARMMQRNPIALRCRCHSSVIEYLERHLGKSQPSDIGAMQGIKTIGAITVIVDDDMPPSCLVIDMSDGSSSVYVIGMAPPDETRAL